LKFEVILYLKCCELAVWGPHIVQIFDIMKQNIIILDIYFPSTMGEIDCAWKKLSSQEEDKLQVAL